MTSTDCDTQEVTTIHVYADAPRRREFSHATEIVHSAENVIPSWCCSDSAGNLTETSGDALPSTSSPANRANVRGEPRLCAICGYSTRNAQMFFVHLRRSHGPGPGSIGRTSRRERISCHEQSPPLSGEPAKTRNEDSSSKQTPPSFACPQPGCGFWASRKNVVLTHTLSKHAAEFRSANRRGVVIPRRCPHCPYVSGHQGNMRIHIMARHSMMRPHLCHLCGRRFADKSYFNLHMRRHSNDFRFHCDLCEAKFIQPSHLRSHLATKHYSRSVVRGTAEKNGPTRIEREPPTRLDPGSTSPQLNSIYDSFMFECIECNTFFLSFDRLKGHVDNGHA